MRQTHFSIVARVEPDKVRSLAGLLAQIEREHQAPATTARTLRFDRLSSGSEEPDVTSLRASSLRARFRARRRATRRRPVVHFASLTMFHESEATQEWCATCADPGRPAPDPAAPDASPPRATSTTATSPDATPDKASPDDPGRPTPRHLLCLECAVDGSMSDAVDILARDPGVQLVFGHCEHGPALLDEKWRDYLKRRAQRPQLYHFGHPGRGVRQIMTESRIRDRLDDEADWLECGLHGQSDALWLHRRLSDLIGAPPSRRPNWLLLDADDPAADGKPMWRLVPDPHWGERVQQAKHWARLVLTLLAVIVPAVLLWPVTFLLGVMASLLIPLGRRTQFGNPLRTLRAVRDRVSVGQAHLAAIQTREDRPQIAQNHVASCIPVTGAPSVRSRFVDSPMWLRRWYRLAWIRVVLFTFNLFYRTIYTEGHLAGIPTIHFAQWSLRRIPGAGASSRLRGDTGWRLFFLSNYDGSWNSYLDDFGGRLANGLGAIWGRARGYPGIDDVRLFRDWARTQQAPDRVWYSAYPDLTVDQVNNHTSIRLGLFDVRDEASAARWLARLTLARIGPEASP